MMKTGFSRFRLETANSISDWGPIPSNLTYRCPCDATCVYPSLPNLKKREHFRESDLCFRSSQVAKRRRGAKNPVVGISFLSFVWRPVDYTLAVVREKKKCFIFEFILYFRICCTGSITSDYTSTCVITHITTNKGQAPFY